MGENFFRNADDNFDGGLANGLFGPLDDTHVPCRVGHARTDTSAASWHAVGGSRARGLDGFSDLADTSVRANLTDRVRAIPDKNDGAEQR